MPDIQKRAGDPEDYDARRDRQWHGAPRRADFPNGGELSLGWGDKAVSIRGGMVIIVILLGLLGGVGFYFHDLQQRDHARQLRAVNVAVCVSLYDFSERKSLREAWQRDPRAPLYWCPNLGADNP